MGVVLTVVVCVPPAAGTATVGKYAHRLAVPLVVRTISKNAALTSENWDRDETFSIRCRLPTGTRLLAAIGAEVAPAGKGISNEISAISRTASFTGTGCEDVLPMVTEGVPDRLTAGMAPI